jgi:hypothetical protein
MDDDRLLTPQELANMLRVPVKSIYAQRQRGAGVPGFRVGVHLRFRLSDARKFIADQIEADQERHTLPPVPTAMDTSLRRPKTTKPPAPAHAP